MKSLTSDCAISRNPPQGRARSLPTTVNPAVARDALARERIASICDGISAPDSLTGTVTEDGHDRSADCLPQTRFGLANHEQSTIFIPREHGHRRKQHQVVANPLAQAAQVRGDAHSDASLQTIDHRRSGPPNMLAPTVRSRRSLMLANSTFRMAYGLGALFVPGAMARFRLAANTREHPQARLFVRGFGAHQIAVATLGLASRRWRTIERPAALAAVTIDVADMISAVVESEARERMDPDLTGGLVFSAAGVLTAAVVLCAPLKWGAR